MAIILYPTLKPPYRPLPGWEGELRLGVEVGIASIIEDPDGRITHLVELMDGQRTLEEIARAAQSSGFDVGLADVEALVDTLVEYGFVEDASIQPPPEFSPAEQQRYSRNFNFFSAYATIETNKYEFQKRLEQSRVLVLGLGSLGSQVVMTLALMGVGRLDLVDHDRVEIANLGNQVLYRESDVGKDKSEAAAFRVTGLNPNVECASTTQYLTSEQDVLDLLNGHQLIIRTADRPYISIHEWVNSASVRAGVPYIGGGVIERQGSIGPFVIPYETGCFGCQLAHSGQEARQRQELMREKSIPSGNVATTVTAGILGHIIALEAVKYLANLERPATANRRLHFNFRTLESDWHEIPRHPACQICGAQVK